MKTKLLISGMLIMLSIASFAEQGRKIPYIINTTYDKINGEVLARIIIQLPYPAMSGCGPSCAVIVVTKKLNADAESFYSFDGTNVAADKNKIFIMGMEHNELKDTSAFLGYSSGLNYSGQIDMKNNIIEQINLVYKLSRTNYDLYSADPATLQIIAFDSGEYYLKDKKNVYYKSSLIKKADAASFCYKYDDEDTGNEVYGDKHRCYMKGKPVRCVKQEEEDDEDEDISEKKRIKPFHPWKTIEGNEVQLNTSPQGMERLGTDYSRDSQYGYYLGKPIPGSDGPTFRFFGNHFAKDARYVYFENEVLPDADPGERYITGINHSSFLTVGETNVYYRGVKTGLDPATFREEGDQYYVDKDKVLYLHYERNTPKMLEIEDVDPTTFVALDEIFDSRKFHDAEYYGKDKKQVYYQNIPLSGSDPNTFEFLSTEYARDKNNVYYEGEIVEGADPATFKCVDRDGYRWMDKQNTYQYGKQYGITEQDE